jgi:hypothetical protein
MPDDGETDIDVGGKEGPVVVPRDNCCVGNSVNRNDGVAVVGKDDMVSDVLLLLLLLGVNVIRLRVGFAVGVLVGRSVRIDVVIGKVGEADGIRVFSYVGSFVGLLVGM